MEPPLKHVLSKLVLIAGSALASLAQASPNVGVSVSINEPGFYGRIDIGDRPAPRVIYQQPVIIRPTPVAQVQRPIYLRVPPGHYRNWARHCVRYRACGQPVYFVDDPRYQRDAYRQGYHEGRKDARREQRREERRERWERHQDWRHNHR